MSSAGDMRPASPHPAAAEAPGVAWRSLLMQAILPITLVLMALGFSLVEPRILSRGNLLNILQQTSYIAMFAMAQMVVILTRGFDLSLGPTVSAVSVLVALIMTGMVGPEGQGLFWAIVLGILGGLGLGAAIGLFNGLVIAWLRVNPFIATLGSLNIALGIATTISDGRPVFGVPGAFSRIAYSGTVVGIPVPLLLALAAIVIIYFVLRHTVVGRSLYILGSNPRAATLAGLPSKRYLTYAYILCSLLAAIGALMLTARTGSGEPNLGGNLTLQSIGAAVIGGVSLRGGVGGVESAVIGALFITVLSNGMNLTQVDGYIQMIVLGTVLIAAVVLDRIRTARA